MHVAKMVEMLIAFQILTSEPTGYPTSIWEITLVWVFKKYAIVTNYLVSARGRGTFYFYVLFIESPDC